MEERITISGMGGQGVISLGNLIAYSGMEDGKNVTVVPSYGAEMRGGNSNSFVILSDQPIGAPFFNNADTGILMYQFAFERYESLVKPEGLLIYNENMIALKPSRKDIKYIAVPANIKANELGNSKVLNTILAGVWCKASGFLKYETVEKVIRELLFSTKKQAVIDVNLKAFEFGYNFIK